MTQATAHGADRAPQHPLLEEWKRLTREGLTASRICCPRHALAWHVSALRVAHQLLTCPQADVSDSDRIAAFIVAHLNIADCHADMDQPSSAAECLNCAYRKVMALLHSDTAPRPLQRAAGRQLHHLYAAMSAYRDKHGEHPLIEKALTECRAYMPVPGTPLH